VSLTVRQYLTVLIFEVDGHRYGLETSRIMEVVRAVLPVRLAQMPDIVEGLINVRGRVAVVIDLRARFELTRRAIVPSDVLLLCESGPRLFALRADATLDLQTVDASLLADPSTVGPSASFARGALTLQDGLLLLCNLESFLSEAEQLSISRALERREASA
jgi:purine-binding chemotaxis protein CheW